MKNLLSIIFVLALSANAFSLEHECVTELAENGHDFKVFNQKNEYLGYVSPNDDGSWYIWLDGSGALNEEGNDKSEAVGMVCNGI